MSQWMLTVGEPSLGGGYRVATWWFNIDTVAFDRAVDENDVQWWTYREEIIKEWNGTLTQNHEGVTAVAFETEEDLLLFKLRWS